MRKLFALSLVLLGLTATNAFAVGEARVVGTIFDGATKKAVPGCTINVVSADSNKNFKQDYKCDKNGSYAIFLLDGTIKYKFTYSAPGFKSYDQVLKLKLGEPNKQDIDLAPESASAPVTQATEKVEADPALVAFNEGAALANEHKDAEAIAKFEEAVAKKPDLTSGYGALARLYARTKKWPKAIENANKVLAIDSDDMDMNDVLFESYTATGDKAKAAEYKKKLPANPAAMFNEAVPLLNAGKFKEAEPMLKAVIAADPNFSRAYYHLGIIAMQNGDNAAARGHFQKYLDLDPKGADADVAREALKALK